MQKQEWRVRPKVHALLLQAFGISKHVEELGSMPTSNKSSSQVMWHLLENATLRRLNPSMWEGVLRIAWNTQGGNPRMVHCFVDEDAMAWVKRALERTCGILWPKIS